MNKMPNNTVPVIQDLRSEMVFSEKTIRLGFTRKVFCLLMCQLIITIAIVLAFTFCEPAKLLLQKHSEILIVGLVIIIVTLITMLCCANTLRSSPANLIVLFLFTIAVGCIIGAVAAINRPEEVMKALVICLLICFGFVLFSFQTKYDFTLWGGILLVALITLVLYGFVWLLFFQSRTYHTIFIGLFVLIYGIYIVYDIQSITGGDHKYSISPEEYVFATINIYLDMILMFSCVLQWK